MTTLGELGKWSRAQLSLYLGPESKTVIHYLHGPFRQDVARYKPQETLQASFAFEEGVLEPSQLEPVLRLLCQRLAAALSDRATSRLMLVATSQGLEFSASRLSKEPLNQPGRLERLAQLALQDSGVLGLEVDALRLELSGLYRPSAQGMLWQQRETAQRAVEAVERRFPGAMLRFDEVNPFMTIPSFRYRLLMLSGGEEASLGPAARGRSEKRASHPHRQAARQPGA